MAEPVPVDGGGPSDAWWRGRRVLVTGGGGFIGSHLVEALARRGARVRALVRYNSRNHWGWLEGSALGDGTEIVRGDVTDAEAARNAVRDVEVVFHLAALMAIPYSYTNPREFVSTNVVGTANLLDAARELGTARFVMTSTSEVYGTALRVPIDEEHPLQAQSPYAATKIAAEKLVESYGRSFAMPVVNLRPFNTYGPRQSTRAFIPTVIAQALASDRVKLGATSPIRDLVFVDDTVRGFLAAGSSPAAVGETVNLATGRGAAVGDVARRLVELVGRPVEIEHDPSRVRPAGSEVHRLVGSTEKAKRILGWEATVSLDDGLRRTVEWFRDAAGSVLSKPHLYAT